MTPQETVAHMAEQFTRCRDHECPSRDACARYDGGVPSLRIDLRAKNELDFQRPPDAAMCSFFKGTPQCHSTAPSLAPATPSDHNASS